MCSFGNTDNNDKAASITNVNLQQDNIKLAGKAFSGFMLYLLTLIPLYISCNTICDSFDINICVALDIVFIAIFIRRNNIKKQDIFLQKCKLKDIAVIIPLMILILAIDNVLYDIFQH